MQRLTRFLVQAVLSSLLFSLFSLVGFAFEVTITDATSIYPNETASYDIQITNTNSYRDTITLSLLPDPKWSFETNPLTYLSSFVLSSGETATFNLRVSPTTPSISSGKYALTIPFVSELTGETKETEVLLQIKNPDALSDYVPALTFVLDAQERIDPRQPAKVKLDIINRNPLNLSEVVVALTSNLYNETKTTFVDPLGSVTVIFEIPYNPQQEPREDLLVLTVSTGDKAFTPIRKPIEIIAYADIVEYQTPAKGFFFKTTTTIEYTNKGNTNVTKEVKFPTSLFAQFFTSTEPKGEIVEEEGLLYYKTSITLPVNESVTLIYAVNYRPILAAFFLVLAGVVAYYLFRSPLVVQKETVTMHVDKEGHMKIKVLIHLKNRSMQLVDDVRIIDKIPTVAELEKHFELGTVKPEKVMKHEKEGTLLVWNIPHLEAYEERIITYKIHSAYHIVGEFTLPAVLVKFKNKKQETVKIRSGIATVDTLLKKKHE